MSEKEHFGTLKNVKITQKKIAANEALSIIDASRLCSLISSKNMSGKLPDATTGSCSTLSN